MLHSFAGETSFWSMCDFVLFIYFTRKNLAVKKAPIKVCVSEMLYLITSYAKRHNTLVEFQEDTQVIYYVMFCESLNINVIFEK